MNKAITRDDQYGMTYAGMLLLMIFIAVIAIVVIKVMPLYMENLKVESSLKSLAEEARNSQSSMVPAVLEKHLLSRLAVNDVDHVTRDDIKITKEGNKTVINISYEARVPLFYNLDIVAKFPDNHIELGGH